MGGKTRRHTKISAYAPDRNSKSTTDKYSIYYAISIVAIAITVAILHKGQMSYMFENDRHFSHLSTVERELTFRTEMGFYYSYYKTLVEAPSFAAGLRLLLRDDVTEFPSTINTLNRFNLYPEVITGALYRSFKTLGLFKDIICYNITRGEGLGEPIFFYVEAVFCLNALHASIFFLYGTYLSGSILGGVLSILSFFYNHSETTRVQWTPPLRESFGFPFFFVQMLAVTYILRKKVVSFVLDSLMICVPLVCFMCSWQFAQFSTLTQLLAVFVVYSSGGIGDKKFCTIICGIALGLMSSVILLFGNVLIVNSFLSTAVISSLVVISLSPILQKLHYRIIIMIVQFTILLTGMIAGKYFIGKIFNISDDAHIGDILMSKFTDFRNFDTMLYTCAAEFDFMKLQAAYPLTATLVLPISVISTIVVGYSTIKFIFKADSLSDDQLSPRSHPEILYNVLQLLAFVIMAVLLMRLKVFMMPHLCLLMCLLASNKVYSFLHTKKFKHIIVIIIAIMSVTGVQNLKKEFSISGEFSNDDFVDCLEFVKTKLPQNAVFAGSMATMATVKLVTGRPIVIHPHYEDAGLRRRTKLVYTAFSRKPLKEVYSNLVTLKAEYLVIERGMCHSKAKPNCTLAEIFDLEDKTNRLKKKTCDKFASLGENKSDYKLFRRVFSNNGYEIYMLL